MTFMHYGGQLSDKQKKQLWPYPVKSRYAVPINGRLYWAWAYTEKQARYFAARRRRREAEGGKQE